MNDVNMEITIREGNIEDLEPLIVMYKQVTEVSGGLARKSHEIQESYMRNIINHSTLRGQQWIALHAGKIVGEIHAYSPEISVFSHILSELTVAVHPDFQSKGIGKMLFQQLLGHTVKHAKHILRIELFVRESNSKAIRFYEQLGFELEGKLRQRIATEYGHEADCVMGWVRR